MTILTENFNGSDGDTMGFQQTWLEESGDIDIVSGKARVITAVALANVTTALATANHYVQSKTSNSTSVDVYFGITARKAAGENMCLFDGNTFTDTCRLFRVIGGSYTPLGSETGVTLDPTTEYLFRLEVDGDIINTSVDGVGKHVDIQDPSLPSNLLCGVRSGGVNVQWDDWEAGDLQEPVLPLINGIFVIPVMRPI